MINTDKNHWLNEWRDKTVILRIENEIMGKTGRTKEELRKMDIGDIERLLKIKAKNPYNKPSLYKFVSQETVKKRKRETSKCLRLPYKLKPRKHSLTPPKNEIYSKKR